MDAMTLLSTRTSIRDLIAPAPGQAELEQILAVAMRAPDHGRLRPWRFIVIEGDERLAFGELLAQALRARQTETTAALLDKERKKPLQAPMIVIVAAALSDHPRVPQIEQMLAVGAAAQTAMLALHALGYGAVWRTGEAAYDPLVKRGLGLAPSDAIIGFIYAGTPDPAVDSTDRSARPLACDNMRRWRRLDLENKTGFGT